MDADRPFLELAIALAIGLIIGVERGWKERDRVEGSRVAGLRTFGLIGLAGGLFAFLADTLSPRPGASAAVLVAGAALIGIALFIAHWRAMQLDNDVSATTNVAALMTYALGALAVLGEPALAGASAVIVALLLGLKPRLHALLAKIEEHELMAALRLLLISVVALPLLPDRGFGPYEALNPYELWWFVVLIAGLSFVGYVAIKSFGAGRGLILTAIAGGLFSSTVVTISFSRLVAEKRDALDAGARRLILAGILIASSIMPLRLLIVVALVSPAVGANLAAPLIVLGLVGFAIAWFLARGTGKVEAPALTLENPVDIAAALRFAALLAIVMLLVPAIREWLGDAGLYLLALVSGFVDVDAISLSTARLAGGEIASRTAIAVILTAVAANTVAKAGWILIIAGARLAGRYALASLMMLGLAAAAALVVGDLGGLAMAAG
jgi:uncharacterized membrane protein (DUF4010 family)